MLQALNGEPSRFESDEEHIREEEQSQTSPNGKALIPSPVDSVSTTEEGKTSSKKEAFVKDRWTWTGFRDKTLWDWVQFATSIALPAVLATLTFQQDQSADQRRVQEQGIALSNQRHEVMTDYLDQMTELILKEKLGQSSSNEQVRSIARARTLNTLRQLDDDGERRGQLLKFLYETDLIGQCETNQLTLKSTCQGIPILDLKDAKLDGMTFTPPVPLQGIELAGVSLANANLPNINLTRADMKQADLEKANLAGAILTDAQMENATLTGINLSDAILTRAVLPGSVLNNALLVSANLQGANLSKATLINANLQGANLNNANLQGADLRNADLTGTVLQGVNLQGSVYNDATKFPEWSDQEKQGMKLCTLPTNLECN